MMNGGDELLQPSLPKQDSVRANRAIGAVFYGAFGGAWIALWAWRTFSWQVAAVSLVAALTSFLVLFVYQRYRRYRPSPGAEPLSTEKQRQDRRFHAINAGQWIAILVAVNVLANVGLSAWVLPVAIFIVGLHFIPLAPLFGNSKHFITGGALMLLAIAYPLLTPAGPKSLIGALGAGIILWASALWAVLY